jgi:hypothetical protein
MNKSIQKLPQPVIKETLRAIKEATKVISNEDNWTQNRMAGTTKELGLMNRVNPRSPKATCWCLTGAFIKCLKEDDPQKTVHRTLIEYAFGIANAVSPEYIKFTMDDSSFYYPIEQFNDTNPHREVLTAARKTIKYLKQYVNTDAPSNRKQKQNN